MIQKLELMVKAVPTTGDSHSHGNYAAEPTVSVLDIAHKVNEIIDYLNIKESK